MNPKKYGNCAHFVKTV